MLTLQFSTNYNSSDLELAGLTSDQLHVACVWLTGHGLEQGSMNKFEVYEILGK